MSEFQLFNLQNRALSEKRYAGKKSPSCYFLAIHCVGCCCSSPVARLCSCVPGIGLAGTLGRAPSWRECWPSSLRWRFKRWRFCPCGRFRYWRRRYTLNPLKSRRFGPIRPILAPRGGRLRQTRRSLPTSRRGPPSQAISTIPNREPLAPIPRLKPKFAFALFSFPVDATLRVANPHSESGGYDGGSNSWR